MNCFEGLFIIDALALPVLTIERYPVYCTYKLESPIAVIKVATDICDVSDEAIPVATRPNINWIKINCISFIKLSPKRTVSNYKRGSNQR